MYMFFIRDSILDHTLDSDKKYDYVISGLPLNAFQSGFVSEVFKKFVEITDEKEKFLILNTL